MMRRRYAAALALTIAMTSLAGCGSGESADSDQITFQEEEAEADTADDATEEEAEAEEGQTYESTEADSHAVIADGEAITLKNANVNKSGDSEGNDEADFYGTNAAVFATNGGSIDIEDSVITTAGSHANAVFSYGEGSTINISNSEIDTTANNSGGIMVTGGGTLNAENVEIITKGGSSAAIRSDRGGGTMTVDGGSYKSYGSGSPAIYSTADITVSNAELYSDISQAVVVEGKNSVTLNDVDATGQNTKKNSDNSDRYQAVMIYQSMSGDASQGKGSFTMNGGSLTSLNEGMFYVTNTVADINLDGVTLNYASDDLLRIETAGWGNEGSNGGQVNFYNVEQSLEGVITVDDISVLNMYLDNGSSFKGSVTGEGQIYVELTNGSTWELTADTAITSLTCDADSIKLNGYKLTVDGQDYEEGTTMTGEAIEITVSEGEGMGEGMPGDGNEPPQMGDGNEPPEMGDGQAPEGMGDGQTPPDKPDGDSSDGGQGGPDDGQGGPGGGQGGPDGGQGGPGGDGQTPPDKPE